MFDLARVTKKAPANAAYGAGRNRHSAIHHVDGARFREEQIERVDIVQLAVRDMDEAGMLPRKSSRVCIFTAALVERKCAQGKTDRHRSMVVESSA